MFNLQGSEIIIVLLLALVVLGPEKLPDAMRKAGKAYAELKKMSSGFQSEFRAAVDEPLREMRETANILRDSADFTKLQSGERDEKPKSGEMAPIDRDQVPSAEIPTFESPADSPGLGDESKPAPFSGVSSTTPRPPTGPTTQPPFIATRIETGAAATDTPAATEAQPEAPTAADDAVTSEPVTESLVADEVAPAATPADESAASSVTDGAGAGDTAADEPVDHEHAAQELPPRAAAAAEATTSSDSDAQADTTR